jgi:hypothetical protein
MGKWRYSSTILSFRTTSRRVVSFTPFPLYPRGKTLGTHWIGVDPIADLDTLEKEQIFLLQGIELRLSNPSLGRPGYPGSIWTRALLYSASYDTILSWILITID